MGGDYGWLKQVIFDKSSFSLKKQAPKKRPLCDKKIPSVTISCEITNAPSGTYVREALGTQIVEQRINSEVQIEVLLQPMNNPLGVSPSKGGCLFPFTGANAQRVIHG